MNRAHSLLEEAQIALGAGNAELALRLLHEAEQMLTSPDSTQPATSRFNPVPFGEKRLITYHANRGFLEITGFHDNANHLSMTKDRTNSPPEQGMRYIAVEMVFTCDKSPIEMCQMTMYDFAVVGSSGIVRTSKPLRGFTPPTDFFGGAALRLIRPYKVLVNETDFVLFNHWGGVHEHIYFAVER